MTVRAEKDLENLEHPAPLRRCGFDGFHNGCGILGNPAKLDKTAIGKDATKIGQQGHRDGGGFGGRWP
jgi:hypothetical protein